MTEKEKRSSLATILLPQIAALLLALPNGIALAQRFDGLRIGQQLALQLVNLGQALLLGWIAGGLAWLWHRYSPLGLRWALGLGALGSLLLGALVLPESFSIFAERHAQQLPPLVTIAALVTLSASLIPAAGWIGWKLSRTRLWAAAPLVALLAVVPNNFVLDGGYWGLHFLLAIIALAFACTGGLGVHRLEVSAPRASRLRVLVIGSGVLAALSVVVPARSTVQRLASLEGAPLGVPIAAVRYHFRALVGSEGAAEITEEERRQWFVRREEHEPIPATRPSMLPVQPIVILLTIDSLRADLVQDHSTANLPFLRGLNQSAVYFRQARAAGPATVPSLTALFSGRYYSQMWWKSLFVGGDVWPNEDQQVRFPEVLQQHGVHTITFASLSWLTNEMRVAPGWHEQLDLDKHRKVRSNHVKSPEIISHIKKRLAGTLPGPTFLYAHLMDPHAPYDSGALTKGTPKALYTSEVERVDGELAELDTWFAAHDLASRVVWIISADHGQAFGEHGTTHHSKTLYDELIRVPLWIRIPGVEPRVVDEFVSLIDLGPTILDLMGAPTPGTFMGQSLVPALRGLGLQLSRPLGAEGRLKQALLFPDGIKAIRDQRTHTQEVYDLNTDPTEADNIVESADPKYLREVDTFFDVHLNPRYTKTAPYRN